MDHLPASEQCHLLPGPSASLASDPTVATVRGLPSTDSHALAHPAGDHSSLPALLIWTRTATKITCTYPILPLCSGQGIPFNAILMSSQSRINLPTVVYQSGPESRAPFGGWQENGDVCGTRLLQPIIGALVQTSAQRGRKT